MQSADVTGFVDRVAHRCVWSARQETRPAQTRGDEEEPVEVAESEPGDSAGRTGLDRARLRRVVDEGVIALER